MAMAFKQPIIIFILSILALVIKGQIPTCALKDGQNQPVSTQVTYDGKW